MKGIKDIEQKINKLSPRMISNLDNYLDFLLMQSGNQTPANNLKQDWAGGLKFLKDRFNSIDLQKLALELRTK